MFLSVKLIPQLPPRCTCQASLCPLLLIGWVALLPWHLVATATQSLAPIHHPDQDWHLMTSSLPIRQACCYYECPSVCHFQLSSGGFKNWCSLKWNGELKKRKKTLDHSFTSCKEMSLLYSIVLYFFLWLIPSHNTVFFVGKLRRNWYQNS